MCVISCRVSEQKTRECAYLEVARPQVYARRRHRVTPRHRKVDFFWSDDPRQPGERLSHQSACLSVSRYVRIGESVFPSCQLPIFICPSRCVPFRRYVADPTAPSVHPSNATTVRPPRLSAKSPSYLRACVPARACILIRLSANLPPTRPP